MRRIKGFVNHSERHSSDQACRSSLAKRVLSRTKSDPEESIEALCEAARDGKLDVVEELCSTAEKMKDVKVCDMVNKSIAGKSPLVAAARNGHLAVVQWLVLNGARINEKNGWGQIALNRAARGGHFEVVQWIVQHGGCVNEVEGDGCSALHEAVSTGHFPMLKWLINQGANVEVRTDCGQTVLHLAASSPGGNVALAKFLVKNGLRAYDSDNRGYSALYYAIIAHNFEIVEFFLQKCPQEEKLARLVASSVLCCQVGSH